MTKKIEGKIVGVSVVSANQPIEATGPVKRPNTLTGVTYKLKTPQMDDAYYVTINDHDGRPFELFIDGKDVTHFQWIKALTRMISMAFRANVDPQIVVDELKAIADTDGGHPFTQLVGMSKPRNVASIPAAIGHILEHHLSSRDDTVVTSAAGSSAAAEHTTAIPGATKCPKCGEMAVVVKDGCPTCLECGDSKCG